MDKFGLLIENTFAPKVPFLNQAATNAAYWSLTDLGIDLYDNQIEIVDGITDLSIPYLGVLASRGSGKTYSAAIGLVKLCLDNPGFRIGIFGPKAETSKRLVKEDIIGRILTPTSPVYSQIEWSKTANALITFKNGSTIKALSASETATQESEHFHVLVIDEAHRVSDWVMREKLVPMLGSFTVAKTIKIGISLYKNNFFHSCSASNTRYKVVRKGWKDCDIYWKQGAIVYEGEEFPKRIVDLMPKVVKQKYFPKQYDNKGSDLWYDSVEGYSEVEWNTQYEMIWMEDINLVLSADQQKQLVSGDFEILEQDRPDMTEKYFFGLDTAGGTLQPDQKDLDFTVLSIWRKTQDNIKQCVARYAWQGDIVEQIEDIKQIIHPDTGVFKCVFGLADYSNIAIGIVEIFKKERIPINGITFGSTEPTTKKNYKNAMVNQFVFELENGRVQYPTMDRIEKNKLFKEGFAQWCLLERHRKSSGALGVNDKIFVDSTMGHDDHCSSDYLAVWAADQMAAHSDGIAKRMSQFPLPSSGISNLAGKGIPMPGYDDPNPNKGRFLRDR